jgi:adenylate cyclase
VSGDDEVPLEAMQMCFEGVVPAVIATASAAGVPNVTYLSRVRMVDHEHIAVSNQFFSKTSRNLAENPFANLVITDPVTFDQFRVAIEYVRTERRGLVFERLREDLAVAAAMHGMQDVFRLRAADIYRVLSVEAIPGRPGGSGTDPRAGADAATQVDPARDAELLAELTRRVGRSADLDTLVGTAVGGLADLFGYANAILLLADEQGERLYTIASHGYDAQGVGSEVVVGEGVVGMAAARCQSMRVGNLLQMTKYSGSVRRSIEHHEGLAPGRDIPVPGLSHAQSQLAVPAQALGELVGVLVVESEVPAAYDVADQHRLEIVASMLAGAIEIERSRARVADPAPPVTAAGPAARPARRPTQVRYFPVDGSTFVDGDYLIKGVAGRILWSLLSAHEADGRTAFTNREVRLDPSLELPEFRDNFESRLILLKRRLDERDAPVRIEKVGRGRFRLVVDGPVSLQAMERDGGS